jgi:hypothetical protein
LTESLSVGKVKSFNEYMEMLMNRCLTLPLCVAVFMSSMCNVAQAQWPLGREDGHAAKSTEARESIMVSGRHQVFISPHAKGHTFMIDTDTGKVWVLKKDGGSGEFSFQRIPVDQVDSDKKEKSGQK